MLSTLESWEIDPADVLIAPPGAKIPAVEFSLNVLSVTVTLPLNEWIAPPCASFPAVEFPISVLPVTVTLPEDE